MLAVRVFHYSLGFPPQDYTFFFNLDENVTQDMDSVFCFVLCIPIEIALN